MNSPHCCDRAPFWKLVFASLVFVALAEVLKPHLYRDELPGWWVVFVFWGFCFAFAEFVRPSSAQRPHWTIPAGSHLAVLAGLFLVIFYPLRPGMLEPWAYPSSGLPAWLLRVALLLILGACGGAFARTWRAGEGLTPSLAPCLPLTLLFLVWVGRGLGGGLVTPAVEGFTLFGVAGVLLFVSRGTRAAQVAKNLASGLWREPFFLVFLFLFATSLRALFAFQLMQADLDPRFLAGPDSGTYDIAAWGLTSGEYGFLDRKLPIFFHNPGPTLFYSGVYWIIGHQPDVIRFLQAVMGGVTCLFVYWIGKRVFDETTGKIAALLVAGRGYLVIYGTYLGAEALGLLFVTATVLLLLKPSSWEVGRRWGGRAFLIGAFLGVATLMRPEYQIFPLAVLLYFLARLTKRKVAVPLLFLLGFTVVLVPLVVRNGAVHDQFALSAPAVVKTQYALTSLNPRVGIPQSISDFDFFRRLGQTFVESPGWTLRAIGSDVGYNFGRFWWWRFQVFNPAFVYFEREVGLMNLIGFLLQGFFVLGLWAGWRYRRPLGLLLLIVGYKTLFHLFVSGNEWGRVTAEPFVNLIQAFGLTVFLTWGFSLRGGAHPSSLNGVNEERTGGGGRPIFGATET